MTQFLSLLVNGISLGAVYALIALGFVIIFKSTEVVSFMQGSLILLGAFLIAHYQESLGFWIALIIGIVGTTLVALLTERACHPPAPGGTGHQPGHPDDRGGHPPADRADPAHRLRHLERQVSRGVGTR